MNDYLKKVLKDALARKEAIQSGIASAPSVKEDGADLGAYDDGKKNYDSFRYDAFTYGPYGESDAVKKAREELEKGLDRRPASYRSPFGSAMAELMERIMNREEFSYDVNADVLYRQYKDQYTNMGKTAMRDAMGRAAAMTGGYGSSYAASVGNQAYQASLQELADVIPSLYEMAYGRYRDEGEALYDEYAMLSDREAESYGRYRDTYADWQKETERLLEGYRDERDRDFEQYTDGRDASYRQYEDDRALAYEAHRDSVEDERYRKEFEEEKRRYEEERAEEQRRYEEENKRADEAYRDEVRKELLSERVEKMSPAAILSDLKEYQRTQDWEGMDEFLRLCVIYGKIEYSQAIKYRERYGKEGSS